MLIGIDVGGTFTDAVLLAGDRVVKKTKVNTRHDNLLQSLMEALDIIVNGVDISKIRRVALSTTLITNLIAEKKYQPVALMLTPGPGLNPDMYRFNTDQYVLQGAMDYRGREIIGIDEKEISNKAEELFKKGYDKIAVVGKFSQRNNRHEILAGDIILKTRPECKVVLGHQVSGQLNYPRRIATTLLTAATEEKYKSFVGAVEQALKERQITAPVYILKADGCTLPLASSVDKPVETIFSGPAASTLGVMALTSVGETSVVVDIGGTTTDLALILTGEPLLSTKGVRLENFLTNVKSFAVKSVPLGGDSAVVIENNNLAILPERKGPAYCLGGPEVTPTDALRVLGKTTLGSLEKALEGMQKLGALLKLNAEEVAGLILEKAADIVKDATESMFKEWEEEPAYRVWEVVQKSTIRPQNLVGVGGAAQGIIPSVAEKMNSRPLVPEHAEVANAIGAAVARPTLLITLRADTEQGTYTIMEEGYQSNLTKAHISEKEVIELAVERLQKRMHEMNIDGNAADIEVVENEVFNIVRGWSTAGKIYTVAVQNPRGILSYIKGGAVNE